MNRSREISLAACVLILAIAVAVGWRDRQRIELSRERNARAISQAAALGISPGSPEKKDAVRITKRERGPRDGDSKREAAELFALLKKADATEDQDETDAEFEKILGRLVSLGPETTELLIKELLADKELKAGNRGGILSMLLMKLSGENPQAVLRLLSDLSGISGDKDEDQRIGDILLTTSLTNWGKKDPRAVGKWIRENAVRFPGAINDSIKCGVLSGAATRDPALALSLIDEMGIGDQDQAVILITRAARTTEGRTATLAALRSHFSRFPGEDSKRQVIHAAVRELALGAFDGGYGPASKWLETAKLDPSEMVAVGSALEFHHTYKETDQWLDWLGKNMPAGKVGEPIGRIMGKWTELDYQDAGRWLAAVPEGPVRTFSIQAYAAAVSKYEPETAAQWAMILPAGKDRDSTLRQVYQNWPKDAAAAREVFAKEHGIE
ncbi:MAG: hypothetical protein V4584_12455 [Verrucomicrobiota bacterium]